MEQSASASPRLPRGQHGIPAEVVARNQRERLIAAMAEACGEHGYVGASATAVAKRAGVSTVTFYKQFEGKEECLLAAQAELSARLLEAVDRAVDRAVAAGGEGDGGGRAALEALLSLLAADPPTARLLTVEILAGGPVGVERHAAMVEQLAGRLGAEWVPVAGALALVGRRVVAGEAERLPALADELAALT